MPFLSDLLEGLRPGKLAQDLAAAVGGMSVATVAVAAPTGLESVPAPAGIDPTLWALLVAFLTTGARVAMFLLQQYLARRKADKGGKS